MVRGEPDRWSEGFDHQDRGDPPPREHRTRPRADRAGAVRGLRCEPSEAPSWFGHGGVYPPVLPLGCSAGQQAGKLGRPKGQCPWRSLRRGLPGMPA